MSRWAVLTVIFVVVVSLVGIGVWVTHQDSTQHANADQWMSEARHAANGSSDQMVYDIGRAQVAEGDRGEAVLFGVGMVTALATFLGVFVAMQTVRKPDSPSEHVDDRVP
jgi:hypothetical protein